MTNVVTVDAVTTGRVAASDVSHHSGGSAGQGSPSTCQGSMLSRAPSEVSERGMEQLRFDMTPPAGVTKDTPVGGHLQGFHRRWAALFPESSVPHQLENGIRW